MGFAEEQLKRFAWRGFFSVNLAYASSTPRRRAFLCMANAGQARHGLGPLAGFFFECNRLYSKASRYFLPHIGMPGEARHDQTPVAGFSIVRNVRCRL